MLKISELAISKSQKITTMCNGKREIGTNYEEVKSYFLEIMMLAEGEELERAKCIYIQQMMLFIMLFAILNVLFESSIAILIQSTLLFRYFSYFYYTISC